MAAPPSGGAGLPHPGATAKPPAAPKPGRAGAPKPGGRGRPQPVRGGLAASPLANPSQTLSGPSLVAAAHGLANAQTRGPLQELAAQIAQNNSQNAGALHQTGQYFNQLGQLGQQGVQDEQGIASGLNSQLAQIAQQEQGSLGQIGTNATSNLLKYSPQSDQQTANPGLSGLTSEIARQQGLAAQQQGALRSFGATQGANYGGLSAANLGSLGLRGQEDLTNIAQAGQVKNEPLMAKVADIQATTGADFATALGKLRQQEITNNIAEQGLGIRAQDITAANQRNQATILGENQRNQASIGAANQRNQATNATSTANNERTNATSRANNAATIAARNAASSGTGSTKPLVLSQQNTVYRNLNEAVALIGQAQAAGHSEQQIRTALATGQLQKGLPALDPYLVQAAYELKGYGYITPQSAAAMRAHGLRGGTFKNKPIQVQAAPGPLASTVGNIGNQVSGALGSIGI